MLGSISGIRKIVCNERFISNTFDCSFVSMVGDQKSSYGWQTHHED